MEKEIKGTLIYQPQGPAGEYAKWGLNLLNGCTHGCTYCYNTRGMMSHAFGDEPKLAAPIQKKADALHRAWLRKHPDVNPESVEYRKWDSVRDAIVDILEKDIEKIGIDRLREDGGVFMSFKCDPLEYVNESFTFLATLTLLSHDIPVTILTKGVDWMLDEKWKSLLIMSRSWEIDNLDNLTIGFSITGNDDMEGNAPSTGERIIALKSLSAQGIKTFVSLEPVINLSNAMGVINSCKMYTPEIRIGVMSPLKKDRYVPEEFWHFVEYVYEVYKEQHTRIIIKESMFKQARFMPSDIMRMCSVILMRIKETIKE